MMPVFRTRLRLIAAACLALSVVGAAVVAKESTRSHHGEEQKQDNIYPRMMGTVHTEKEDNQQQTFGIETDLRITGMCANVARVLERPRDIEIEAPPESLSGWFTTWRISLQVQVDGLLTAVEEYSAALRAANESVKTPMDNEDGRGFRIVLVGDSTMRMQAEMMSHLLSSRRMNDGREQCETRAYGENVAYARCKGNSPSSNDQGDIFSMEYVRNWHSCVVDEIDADFVYFGCGLHLLQLIPARSLEQPNLDTWVHYERLLEEAVLFYRSGGVRKDQPAREPIGIAFFTTHSIFDAALNGLYATLPREYRDKDPDLMAECRETIKNTTADHPRWLYDEYQPEEICDHGTFDDTGVVDLNRRAEAVMERLGVGMVRGYDFTRGQSWATALSDGRHYPYVIPLELSSFLAEVTASLRRKQRNIPLRNPDEAESDPGV